MKKENFNYNGTIPETFFFLSSFDTPSEHSQKQDFLLNWNKNEIWNFKDQLLKCFDQKIFLLAMGFLKFFEECFDFQIIANCSIRE